MRLQTSLSWHNFIDKDHALRLIASNIFAQDDLLLQPYNGDPGPLPAQDREFRLELELYFKR